MNGKTKIQLLGAPSTTYTYVKHILHKVMDRADISVHFEEITDIKKIIEYNIDVIPTLKIDDKAFPFRAGRNTNDVLKEAILYLLAKEEFGNWPVLVLATEKEGTAFYLARDLAEKYDAAVEWVLEADHEKSNTQEKDFLHKRVKDIISRSRADWMGQLFANPLIHYRMSRDPEKSACLSANKKWNAVAVITDRNAVKNGALLKNWMQDCRVPLIIAKDGGAYQTPQNICLVGDSISTTTAPPLLEKIVNGKKHNISFCSILPALSGAMADREDYTSEVPDFCALAAELSRSPQPDMWAIQLTTQKKLQQFLDNECIQQWMHTTQQPLIFLPAENN